MLCEIIYDFDFNELISFFHLLTFKLRIDLLNSHYFYNFSSHSQKDYYYFE